jgi:hypothetical protein
MNTAPAKEASAKASVEGKDRGLRFLTGAHFAMSKARRSSASS